MMVLALVAGAALLGSAGLARGQNLPDALIAQAELTAAQQQQVVQYAQGFAADLAKEPEQIKRARDGILAPLGKRDVGVGFRQAYATALVDDLKRLAADQRDLVAANAMRIAGELATSTSVSVLLEGLKDARSPVKYAASFGLARAFDQASRTAPAINPADQQRALGQIRAYLEAQTDAHLADGAVLAFVSACRVESIRAQAVSELAKGASARARAIDPAQGDPAAMFSVVARAATAIRNAAVPTATGGLPESATRDALALAGDLLAAASRTIKVKVDSGKDLAPVVKLGETLLLLTAKNLGATIPKLDSGDKLDRGDLTGFQQDIEKLLGAQGPMKGLGFADDRFKF